MARIMCFTRSVFDTLGDRRLDEHVLTGLFQLVPLLLGTNAEQVDLKVCCVVVPIVARLCMVAFVQLYRVVMPWSTTQRISEN
jgi:hypothetical protein